MNRAIVFLLGLSLWLAIGCSPKYVLPGGQKVPVYTLQDIAAYENGRRASVADSSFVESQAQRNRDGISNDAVADQIAARNRDSRYEGRSQTYKQVEIKTATASSDQVLQKRDAVLAEAAFHENTANVGKKCPYADHVVR